MFIVLQAEAAVSQIMIDWDESMAGKLTTSIPQRHVVRELVEMSKGRLQ